MITVTLTDDDGSSHQGVWIAGLGHGPVDVPDADEAVHLTTLDELTLGVHADLSRAATYPKVYNALRETADALGILPAGVNPALVNFPLAHAARMLAALHVYVEYFQPTWKKDQS